MRFIKPIGLYPPMVVSSEDSPSYFRILPYIIINVVIRFLWYPLAYTIYTLITALVLTTAMFFNVLGCLGGFFNEGFSKLSKWLNEIALTRFGWLIVDPMAFIWNQINLLAGLFFPKIAEKKLNMLEKMTSKLSEDLGNYLRWQSVHFTKMDNTAEEFHTESQYQNPSSFSRIFNYIIATIILEPMTIISMSFAYPLGWQKRLTRYGLNPTRLTPEQKQYHPVIFLHGDLHNASGALDLAKHFQAKGEKRPIFTVTYPTTSSNFFPEDNPETQRIILDTMQKIIALYQVGSEPVNLSFDLIGHSRGASVITSNLETFKAQGFNIHKVVMFGPADFVQPPQTPETRVISGQHDYFFPKRDHTTHPNHFFSKAGHVGILSSPDGLEHCREFLGSL